MRRIGYNDFHVEVDLGPRPAPSERVLGLRESDPCPSPGPVSSHGGWHVLPVSTSWEFCKCELLTGSRTFTSYDKITIVRSNRLNGLVDGEQRTIWTDTNTTRSANMWAPELHRIDDVWYMFYSSCDASQPCCDSCSTRVLRGCSDAGPYDCEFEHLADLIPPEGQRGGYDNNFAFSIDGTFLEVPGFGRYHVLSIRDNEFNQAIAITALNTDTWTVGGWHVISIPDQPWERNITGATNPPQENLHGVNEAPHVGPSLSRNS